MSRSFNPQTALSKFIEDVKESLKDYESDFNNIDFSNTTATRVNSNVVFENMSCKIHGGSYSVRSKAYKSPKWHPCDICRSTIRGRKMTGAASNSKMSSKEISAIINPKGIYFKNSNDYDKNATNYLYETIFICEKHGTEFKAKVKNLVSRESSKGCPECKSETYKKANTGKVCSSKHQQPVVSKVVKNDPLSESIKPSVAPAHFKEVYDLSNGDIVLKYLGTKAEKYKSTFLCLKHDLEFTQGYYDIKRQGFACPECRGRTVIDDKFEHVKNVTNGTVELLKFHRTNALFRCTIHNVEFTKGYYDIKKSTGCPICNGKIVDKFAHIENITSGRLSLLEYKPKEELSKFKCNIHDVEFERVFRTVKANSGCPQCNTTIGEDKFEYVKRVTNGNTELISFGKREDDYLSKFKCNIHNVEFERNFYRIQHSHGCSKCNKNSIDEDKFAYTTKVTNGKFELIELGSKEEGYKSKFRCIEHDKLFERGFYELTSKKGFTGCIECTGKIEDKFEYTKDCTDSNVELLEFGNKDNQYMSIFKCNEHNIEFSKYFYDINRSDSCPKCSATKSTPEESLCEKLDELGIVYERRNRKILPRSSKGGHLELDIYIPDAKVAIEVHGIYWHSDVVGLSSEKKTYENSLVIGKKHLRITREKYNGCKEMGITLLTFLENEIYDRLPQIVNMIASKANKLATTQKRIYARKIEAVYYEKGEDEIVDKAVDNFLNENHLQGRCRYINAMIGFYGDEICNIMLFDHSHSKRGKSDKTDIELVRYVTSDIVVGGFSKLLKAYTSKFPNIQVFSYSDDRFSTGNMYEVNGFILENKTHSDYMYVYDNFTKIMRKNGLQKSRMEKLASIGKFVYDGNLTEYENAFNNGYYRLRFLGKKKWVYNG